MDVIASHLDGSTRSHVLGSTTWWRRHDLGREEMTLGEGMTLGEEMTLGETTCTWIAAALTQLH